MHARTGDVAELEVGLVRSPNLLAHTVFFLIRKRSEYEGFWHPLRAPLSGYLASNAQRHENSPHKRRVDCKAT